MIIKHTINFYLNKSKERNGNAPLHCYVIYNSIRIRFNTGYNINIQGWNIETQRCKKNTFHDKQNISATYINKELSNIEDVIAECFAYFDNVDILPTKEEWKERFDILTGKKQEEDTDSFLALFDKYITYSQRNAKWAKDTEKHICSLRNQMEQFDKHCKIADFDKQDMPERLLNHFLSRNEGNSNITITRKIKYIKAILRFAIQNRIIDSSYFLNAKISLKTPKKPVIFLTWEELMKVYNFDFSNKPYLDSVRDVFCFCCFTSLRYSDVANLKQSNIVDDTIQLTTIKTADTLSIELNKYSKAILDKHQGKEYAKDRVLPVISNQKMNEYLKKMAKACEIDSPITITTYKGTKRIETTLPKYKLISSHAGRRTFISNAIMLGIAPEIVMKWSGHSDYKAMKPYIEIANEAKRKAMAIFDEL